MQASLHMGCSVQNNAMCSNIACSGINVHTMHETAKRLLDVGLERGAKDFAEIAKRLNASDQSATNWKTRGVPQKKIIEAGILYGVDPVWLATGQGQKDQKPISDIAKKIAAIVSEMPEIEQAKLLHYLSMKIEMDRQMAMVSQPYEAPAQDRRKSA